MNRKALIVIDAQHSFRHSTYWSENDLPAYLEKQQALIDGCVQHGIPVIQVLHVEDQGHFSLASGNVRALSELSINPDLIIHKRYHSAFAGTPLAARLTEMGVTTVIISGIRTEQCCETTTRQASDSGLNVDFVSEATMTFPMTHARSGRVYTAAEIRERTELVLEGRFARIASVAQALEG
ncbi:cysteine hydrolase family protein [Pseudomonas sp. O64]|uniref:cysteine hydrolase family protein n=1 Tax=Pseudomonas TaxID=286 RepID=UPI000BA011C0|nr:MULTISPECIES: isochorismatase family protein [unclassified Pseudomonas]MCV2228825.1 isochorismatase family protein [Pseudomonas sp. AU10]OZO05244.1 hydrolase [Pseudomonas sp. IB20]UNM18207.1 isochorismatase family protein [Pseudomonas sp. ArH3a]UXZ20987.1 isochorismatase family protein [Pseudomonas sp. YeP6b]